VAEARAEDELQYDEIKLQIVDRLLLAKLQTSASSHLGSAGLLAGDVGSGAGTDVSA
jgi:hypothetical protein